MSSAFFKKMTPEMQDSWLNLELHSKYKPETTLFQEQQQPHGLYVINTGKVRVAMSNSDGRKLNFQIASNGDILGLVPVFNNTPYDTMAETIEPCEISYMSRPELLRFIDRYPETNALIMDEAMRSLTIAHTALRVLGLPLKAEEKVVRLWLEWGSQANDTVRVDINMTHTDMGAFIGSSRENITRIMTRFKKKNLISVSQHVLTIPSVKRLQAHVGMA